MQFKYANGNRVTLQDVMVINSYYKNGKLAKDNFIFSDNLTKEQKHLLNSAPKVDVNSTKMEYDIEGHPEIQKSVIPSDGLADIDKTEHIPLINNHDLKQSFDNASSFYWVDKNGNGQMFSRSEASVIAGGNKDLLKLYDLPSIIKEDAGIKSIDITINQAFSSDLNDKEFAAVKQGLNNIGNQLKVMYQQKSGVQNINVHINTERTKDFQKVNSSTPDVLINLKR